AAQTLAAAGTTLKKGNILTIDGSTGQVLAGRVAMLEPALSGEFATLMGWADKVRRLKVRANADTPNDARVALKFGTEGIGLCRTEHMFFDADRIRAVREMILSDDEKGRRATRAEFDLVKARIDAMAQAVAKETGTVIDYQVGTMIELPRACLKAGEIAETAEFFSFGTNDLTQTTFGISRDDAASFLGAYTSGGILTSDPFVTLDREGVGELIRIATERGREARATLKLGICGE